MFVNGHVIGMIMFIVTTIAIYWYMERVKKGAEIFVRPLPAMVAIDEAMGRCAETGKPAHFTPGFSVGGLNHPIMGPGVMAGLTILNRVAESAAKHGVRLIVSLAQPEAVALATEIVSNAYKLENQPVPIGAVRFISSEQYPYTAGVLSTLMEERPAANLMFGYFWSEALQFAQAGNYLGCMQLAGTDSIGNLPFLVLTCDYCLIGEELYAAAGSVEKSPAMLGSLRGQDILRLMAVISMILIWLGSNFGLSWITDLFRA